LTVRNTGNETGETTMKTLKAQVSDCHDEAAKIARLASALERKGTNVNLSELLEFVQQVSNAGYHVAAALRDAGEYIPADVLDDKDYR